MRGLPDLQVVIDAVPAMVWSARTDGSAEYFNRQYLEYVGLDADEARGWGWTAAVHPDDLQGLSETWAGILGSQAPGEAEARLRRHDGEYRWFLFRASPMRDAAGEIVQWYGVNTDVEDRRQAEVDLRRAYESFKDAQRLSRTGNFTADIVVDEHVWSEELYRIFEFDPSTPISVQMVRDVIHPDDLPGFDADFTRSLGGVDFDQVFRIIPASGETKHVHAVGYVVERVAGRPLFLGAIQDVTDRIVAADALNQARAELAHVTRSSTASALTASIAHEVSQPIAGILTNAGTCLRMLDPEALDLEGARETARRIIRDGNRAADIVTRLRGLIGRREFTLEPLDLDDAIREVIALSAGDLQRRRVLVQAELAPDLPPVTGDRIQLQQVIINLVRNASEAMDGVEDRPRRLLISAEADVDDVRVSVRDTGVGVDPESSERLFGAFHTTKAGGMGIGLFVSRSIIERHQGRLWAESNTDGPGATFSFSIPRSIDAASDRAPVTGPS
jgi:PAS domain S-box-containing protein